MHMCEIIGSLVLYPGPLSLQSLTGRQNEYQQMLGTKQTHYKMH